MTQNSASRHVEPRIFATTAPREALLARIDSSGEAEAVVDPALLGEVTQVPRRLRRAQYPRPLMVRISETEATVVPEIAHWRRYPRAR